jgi:hypothetical protein
MGRCLTLAVVIALGIAAAAQAQQASGSTTNRGLGTGTPGGTGTTGTISATPGAGERQTIPGGGIPMGAATQDTSKLPADPSNFDSGGSSKRR